MTAEGTVQPLRAVTCIHCGDQLGFTAEPPYSTLGKCCDNLPEPWVEDPNTGTFTAEAGSDEDGLRQGYPSHECQGCGNSEFVMTTYQVNRSIITYHYQSDEGDEALYFDSSHPYTEDHIETLEEEVRSVRCTNCNEPWHGEWQWS